MYVHAWLWRRMAASSSVGKRRRVYLRGQHRELSGGYADGGDMVRAYSAVLLEYV